MRVALLTNFVPPYRLPVYQALARLVGELRVFVSTRMESDRAWPVKWDDLDVIVQRSLTFQETWNDPEFREVHEVHIPYDTWPQLRRWQPDAIIAAEMGARSLQSLAFARYARRPIVLWATLSDRLEVQRAGWARKSVRRLLTRYADAFIVNGRSGAQYLRRFGVRDHQITTVPYTIDASPFEQLTADRGQHEERVLLYVGAVSERKGVELLARGLKRWATGHPSDHVSAIIVGDGPLRALIEAHSFRNVHLEWVGGIDYAALTACYGRAGIFVFPTLGDEWGVVVNEALASGLPVLGSSRSQAVEELVVDGENGWVFSPDSVDSVASAIGRALATNSQRLAEMRLAARSSVRAVTPQAAATRIFALLEHLVQQRRRHQ